MNKPEEKLRHPNKTGKVFYEKGYNMLTGNDGQRINLNDAIKELLLAVKYGDNKAKRLLAMAIMAYDSSNIDE